MTPLEALVVLMLAWVPCQGEPDACLAKYESIAADAVATAQLDPLPTKGLTVEQRTERTAVMLLATASLESRFEDSAVSSTGAKCMMQVVTLKDEDVSTRPACMRVALSRLHHAWLTCGALGRRDWLSVYKTGKCYNEQRDARVNQARAAWGWERFKVLTRKI